MAMAVLLVAGRGHRSLLPESHGCCRVPEATRQSTGHCLPRQDHSPSGNSAQVSHLRQGTAVLVQPLQAMVQATQDPPAIRGRRPLRQHRRHRAIHPDAEGRRAPTHSHPAQPPEDAPRTRRDRRLAQLLPASQLARRADARRTISAYPCRLPKTAIRAQAAMAQQFALRLAEGQGPGRARSAPATRGGLPPGTQAPAHHHAEARGVTVSGIPASRL